MTRLELVPATRADVEAFRGYPNPYSMRGYVVKLDGKPVAIGGINYDDGFLALFSEMSDEMRPFKVSIVKFALEGLKLIGRAPCLAVADPDEPMSGRLLEFLGFVYVGTTEQGRVFKWHQHSRS